MKERDVITAMGLSKRYYRGPEVGWSVDSAVRRIMHLVDPSEGVPFWALRDATFSVASGEVVGVIGRNGAGKSTLLKILARLTYPTEGEAVVRGQVTSLIGVSAGINPRLSGRDNIHFKCALHGMSPKQVDRLFDSIVDFAEIGDFIDTPVKYYSSGMQSRLAFSVASHLDVDILFLDEVLAVGDISFKRKCLDRVVDLTSSGRTVIMVSHSPGSVTRFCSRALWLDSGRIRMDGLAEDVVEAYVSESSQIVPSRTWVAESDEEGESGVARDAEGTSPAPPPHVAIPSGRFARLVSARVIDRDLSTISNVPIDEPIAVEVVYDVLSDGKSIQPMLQFETETGARAFVAAYTDPEHFERDSPPGRYATRAWIPGNLLNQGVMCVTVMLTTPEPMTRHCIVERALSFHVFDGLDREGTARGAHTRPFPGVLRPKLEWETRFQSDRFTEAAARS